MDWVKMYSDQIIFQDFNFMANFAKKTKEVSVVLKSYKHRKLTWLGKITVIKTGITENLFIC